MSFALAQIVKGVLTPELARKFDSSHDGRKVVIRSQIVEGLNLAVLQAKYVTAGASIRFPVGGTVP